MIKSKKLSGVIAASIILAGGTVLGMQTVGANSSMNWQTGTWEGPITIKGDVTLTGNVNGKAVADSDQVKANADKLAAMEDTINVTKNVNAGGAVNAGSVNSRSNITAKDTISGKTITASGTIKGKDLIGSNSITSQGTISATGNISTQATVGAKEMVAQTNVTANNKVVGMQGVVDNTLASGNYVKAGDTVGQNVDALDQQVKANTTNISNLTKNVVDITNTQNAAIQQNSKAIVSVKDMAQKGIDKANAEIHTNAGNIAQNKADIAANKGAIADEAAAREAGDTKEANERTAADNALQTGLNKEIATREDAVTRLQDRIHDVSKEVDTVGALSMAMSGLHPLSYDEGDARFQLSAAVGTYDGTEALALGGFYHFNHDALLSVGVATDLGADEHRMGANIGYTRRIGQGGRVVNPSAGTVSDIMKDIQALKDKQAALEEENDNLKKQLAALQK